RSSLHLLLGRTLPPRLLQLTVEQLPPQRHRGLEFLLSDPLPDLLTRPRRLHERQPVPRRALTLVRDDLDRVPVLQLPRQRRDPAVHLRTRTVQSDLRVHREREVDRRRPLRQLLHVPPRREDEDLVLEQVDPKELHELLGLLRLLLPLQDLPEPRQRLIDVARRRPVPFLVPPVRRDTVLRGPVHFVRPDLDLVQPPARPEDRGVQRPVHVRLRRGDVVVEPLLQRRPLVVDHAQRVIAVRHRVRDHPDRHQVVDLVERPAPLDHLPMDRPHILRPPVHLARAPRVLQLLLQRLPQRLDLLLPLRPPLRDLHRQLAVRLRLQVLERQILQLPLDLRHPQPVRQRGVDLHRLQRDATSLVRPQRVQRPHVVQPVRELPAPSRAAACGSSPPAAPSWTGTAPSRSSSPRPRSGRSRHRTPPARPPAWSWCPPPRRGSARPRWTPCPGGGPPGSSPPPH